MIKLIQKISYFIIFCVMTHLSYANVSIPFELINGLIIVEAEINGTKGNYIIDSGSNGILLNESSESSAISYQTLTSTLEGSETKIESFRVGDFEISELLGFSTDLSNLETYLEKPIAGILGCSIFTPNSILFDFSNSNMIISEQDSPLFDTDGLTSLSFEIIEDLPITKLNIEGDTYVFILDSGASSHFIDSGLLDKYKNTAKPTGVEKSIVTAGGKDQLAMEYIIPNCTIGNQESKIRAFEKDFTSLSNTLGNKISGLLSLSKLSNGFVYFDLKAKKLYFK